MMHHHPFSIVGRSRLVFHLLVILVRVVLAKARPKDSLPIQSPDVDTVSGGDGRDQIHRRTVRKETPGHRGVKTWLWERA